MSNRCEDYPCCGHTDGLGCNWTAPSFDTTVNPHALCDHENGDCDAEDDFDEDECQPHNSYCANDDEDCLTCRGYWLDFHADGMEDQWLDGSYEE